MPIHRFFSFFLPASYFVWLFIYLFILSSARLSDRNFQTKAQNYREKNVASETTKQDEKEKVKERERSDRKKKTNKRKQWCIQTNNWVFARISFSISVRWSGFSCYWHAAIRFNECHVISMMIVTLNDFVECSTPLRSLFNQMLHCTNSG